MYCEKENEDAEINFILFFLFFPFLTPVTYGNLCQRSLRNYYTRIFKFGTNVGFDLLYCVKENQPPAAYHSLYLSTFLSRQSNFLLQISHLL